MFDVKAFHSFKHEGPTTSMRHIGVICQALNTEAITSFCQAYDGAMCSDLHRIHCFLASTWRGGMHRFFFLSPVRLVAFANLLRDLSCPLGLSLRPSRSCLSMPPKNLCHAGGWHLRRKQRVELHYVPVFIVVLLHVFTFAGWSHTALN